MLLIDFGDKEADLLFLDLSQFFSFQYFVEV